MGEEFKTISAKLPNSEIRLLKEFAKRSNKSPSMIIRNAVKKEVGVSRPSFVAGENIIKYNNLDDCFSWLLRKDSGEEVVVFDSISFEFVNDLFESLNHTIKKRAIYINKNKKNSVPIPGGLV